MEAINYQTDDKQASWCGVSLVEGDQFKSFLTSDVPARLNDEQGSKEFEAHLRGLANTGFANDSLNEILSAEIPEERDWAIGEAMAEAYLARSHNIIWPWNMERDKRTPMASLPGADLVGFETNGHDVRLALGEVKTSADQNAPPGVVYGRSGMTHQIEKLACELGLLNQLLKWLLPRCKHTEHEENFNSAVILLLTSGNKDVALFGVLIRDTEPNELDLKSRGEHLAKKLQDPTTCNLLAIYLPCSIADLPMRVSGGAA